MTTHSERGDKLIAEIKLEYGEEPVTLWWDRNKRRYVAKYALDKANRDFYYNRRFDLVGSINENTPIDEIRQMLESTKRLNIYEQPIKTSMQNLKVDWE